MDQYVLFKLNDQIFALQFSIITRVVRAVAIREISHASPHVMGVIDLHGNNIAVANMRSLLNLPSKELDISDYFLICSLDTGLFALWIDQIVVTVECEKQPCEDTKAIPLPECVDHFIKYEEKIIPVYSIPTLFAQTGISNATQPTQ